jgi:signal transduction histidine kinase
VRDTGIGMDEKELNVALEPFRALATANRWGSDGTGLGLPLTKALAEANRARFAITSKVNDGTLVEVAFPAAAHAPAK